MDVDLPRKMFAVVVHGKGKMCDVCRMTLKVWRQLSYAIKTQLKAPKAMYIYVLRVGSMHRKNLL